MAFLKRRRFLTWIGMAVTSLLLVIGSQFVNLSPAVSDTTLNVYAAVSLTDALNAIEAQYQSDNPGINFVNRYDSSGILLNEIRNEIQQTGASADIFISAAVNQINALNDEGGLDPNSITNIVTNQLVLITPTFPTGSAVITSFNDLDNLCDDIRNSDPNRTCIDGIAIGDPTIVPAGNYAEELFASRGIDIDIQPNLVLASNVRNVLNAVANGTLNGVNIDAGVVYFTDALTATDSVTLVDIALPQETEQIVYPLGILSTTSVPDDAQAFADYLTGDTAQNIFRNFAFGPT